MQSNNNECGFKNGLYLSNKESGSSVCAQKNYIAFINYDYKNEIESFSEKENNPLKFPKLLFVEVEKTILFNELDFGNVE